MSENYIQPFQGQNGVIIQSVTVQRLEKDGSLIEMIPVVLLDVSGSMNQETKSGKSKIQILNEVVKTQFGAVRKFAFSSHCFECFGELDAFGDTDLIKAFRFLPKGNLDLCLLSDGYPNNDESDCIEVAKGLGYSINVLYIGDPGNTGEMFMIRLAKATGGKIMTIGSLNLDSKQLGEEMVKLLTEK